eukprot:92909_1
MAITPTLSLYLKERDLTQYEDKFIQLNLTRVESIASIPTEFYTTICDNLNIPQQSSMTRCNFAIMVNEIKNKFKVNANNANNTNTTKSDSASMSFEQINNNNTNNNNTNNNNTNNNNTNTHQSAHSTNKSNRCSISISPIHTNTTNTYDM